MARPQIQRRENRCTATPAEPLLAGRGLTKRYAETVVFEDLDVAVRQGEILCLLGPSGCGKTTLLHLMAGLEDATAGELLFEDDPVTGPDYRRGLVFQDPHLYPWLTVRENIEFGPEIRGETADADRVDRLIEMIGLEAFADATPAELSGGMAQRVALARTLANDPELLLLDEPFSALDEFTKMQLQDDLLELRERLGLTAVFVTHDIAEAVYLGDRIGVMAAPPHGIAEVIEVDLDDPDRDSRAFLETQQRVFRSLERETTEESHV